MLLERREIYVFESSSFAVLRRLGVKGVEIKKPEQLDNVSSLIIPGGESTTMAKLAEFHKLVLLSLQLLFVYKSSLLCLLWMSVVLTVREITRLDENVFYFGF